MAILLEVNGRKIGAESGETILSAMNRSGLNVPTLCSMKGLSPTGACRMCVVEVEGRENLVPACSFPVSENLVIRTHSPRVLKARKTNVELLLSNHPDDCLYCERNGTCELQSLAEDLYVRERRMPVPGRKDFHKVDRSSPAIIRDPAKCILCGRCVRVCEEIMKTFTLDFAHRGNELCISTTLDKPLNYSNCTSCGQCVIACPTGALIEHAHFPELERFIHDPGKIVVAQYTPAVAISVAEMAGYKPGTDLTAVIREVLRRSGIDHVFDSAMGADLMIMEQARILSARKEDDKGHPLITSSCPAWVTYVENFLPELIPHLSPLRSPQQILGALVKKSRSALLGDDTRDIVSVVISSCTAAKSESRREEMTSGGMPLVDLVLTTRELARMIRLSGLELGRLENEFPVESFPYAGSAGQLTGVAGGETEAIMRTVYHDITGSDLLPTSLHRFRVHRPYREMILKAGSKEFRVAAVSGLANALTVLEEIRSGKKEIDLLEVMACPEGCVNGGGQPLPADEQLIRSRTRAIYDKDNGANGPASHHHQAARSLLGDIPGKPGEPLNREILYTTFSKREVLL